MRTPALLVLGFLAAAAAPALADAADLAPPSASPAAAASAPSDAAAPPPPAVITPCVRDASAAAGPAVEDDSLSGKVKHALAEGNMAFALILVLFGGLLTALSPCVYPLIPITLSILGARQAGSHLKGFALSATYVSGMVILYSGLGVGFAATGALAGSALQSPLVTIGVALFCIVMASSMFGAFELALPSGLQTRLSQAGGAGFKGAFIMGLVAGIIAAPCTGPVLSFILTLIARDGDVAKGALLMFTYALGMGLPFLVLGTFSQAIARMPRSGSWMEVVKGVFGLLMLGAGLYYLHIAFPAFAALIAPLGKSAFIGPVLVVIGVVIGALHLSFKMGTSSDKARKGAGVAIATAGIVAFIAWATAAPAAEAEAATPSNTQSASAPAIAWTVIKNEPEGVQKVEAALADAKRNCKPAMIDFFAEWCVACKELDHKTYVDGDVRAEAARFAAVKIDATDDSDTLDVLRKRYGVQGLPTVVFVDGGGDVMTDPNVTGFVDAPTYLGYMKRVH